MLEAARRVELAPLEVFDQGIAEDAVPSIEVGQLLRSLPQASEEPGNAQKSAASSAVLAMRAGDDDRGSAGMLGLPADGLEQQRPAGDRLAMLIGVGQADEQVPPIGSEGDDAGHELAAFDVVGGEAAPAPLVLQFVEIVLGIAAAAVELGDGQQLGLQRGHQHGVFPSLATRVHLDKAELPWGVVRSWGGAMGQAPAQQHDAALPTPSEQSNLAPLALPAGAGVLPIALP